MKIFTLPAQILNSLTGQKGRIIPFHTAIAETFIQNNKTVFMEKYFTAIGNRIASIYESGKRFIKLNKASMAFQNSNRTENLLSAPARLYKEKNDVAENATSFYFSYSPAINSSEKKSFMKLVFPILRLQACKIMLNVLLVGFVALMLASIPNSGKAQVTQQVAWTNAYNQTTGTGTSVGFAIGTGTNRILIVAVTGSLSASGTITTPTVSYGGVALTNIVGDGTATQRTHTWLFYLLDNAIMNGTSQTLSVALTSGSLVNMSAFYAVFAGVNQTPSTYTSFNSSTNTSGSGPAELNLTTGMTINANAQAIYVSSIYDANATTAPGYTVNANWTSKLNNTGSNTTDNIGWKNEVANRTAIPTANTTDNAATSGITPANSIRWSMSGMALSEGCVPPAAPTVTSPVNYCQNATANALTATGTNLLWYTAPTGGTGSSTAPTPSTASTGSVSYYVSQTVGCESPRATITVNVTSNPGTSVTGQSNVSCFAGSNGTITIQASGGTAPYTFSVNNGGSYVTPSPAGTNPYTYSGLSANIAYKIRVKDSNGCQSQSVQ